MLLQRFLVGVLPQSLLLSIYCHKHMTVYCFSCAATKTLRWCTARNPVTFCILPQSLLLSVYCHKAYYFLYTATKPIAVHILPLTLESITFNVLPQRLFVGVLPQSLLLSIYCNKHLTVYCFSCAASNVEYITVTDAFTLQTATISDAFISFHILQQMLSLLF